MTVSPVAFRLLPLARRPLPSTRCLLPSASPFLPATCCLLPATTLVVRNLSYVKDLRGGLGNSMQSLGDRHLGSETL